MSNDTQGVSILDYAGRVVAYAASEESQLRHAESQLETGRKR
jgi:hypothetical protein